MKRILHSPLVTSSFVAPPTRGHIEFRHVRFSYTEREWCCPISRWTFVPGRRWPRSATPARAKAASAQAHHPLLRISGWADSAGRLGHQDARSGQYRLQIGLVPQEPFLFSGSVADNIRYGRPEVSEEQGRWPRCTISGGEWLAALPAGLPTDVERARQQPVDGSAATGGPGAGGAEATRRSLSSTRLQPASIPSPRRKFRKGYGHHARPHRRSSSPTARSPCATPTASSSWATAGSLRKGDEELLAAGDIMPNCTTRTFGIGQLDTSKRVCGRRGASTAGSRVASGAAGVSQLAQSALASILPDALARHAEVLADLFQCVVFAVVEAEAHLQHLALALIERPPARGADLFPRQFAAGLASPGSGGWLDDAARKSPRFPWRRRCCCPPAMLPATWGSMACAQNVANRADGPAATCAPASGRWADSVSCASLMAADSSGVRYQLGVRASSSVLGSQAARTISRRMTTVTSRTWTGIQIIARLIMASTDH